MRSLVREMLAPFRAIVMRAIGALSVPSTHLAHDSTADRGRGRYDACLGQMGAILGYRRGS